MPDLPLPAIAFFLLTVVVGLALFAAAVRGSRPAIILAVVWICLQSAIALTGFYRGQQTFPPHFLLAAVPPLLAIAATFATAPGRRFVDALDLKWCVLLHTIRILVEINLFWLFRLKQVPALMTFEAGNLDILSGLTAPLAWWAYRKGHIGRPGLLIWNTLCLLLVLNAFVRAILSAPFRFQRFAFDQPTIAILSFPFVLLPAFLVPAVLFCHFAIYRKLARRDLLPGTL